jgi:hypothetical protein
MCVCVIDPFFFRDRFHLESTMVALFTLEYLLRMFAHSDSFRLLKKFFLCKSTVMISI